MNKPTDFLVGMVDFFTIILPGSILTFLLKIVLKEKLSDLFIYSLFSNLDNVTSWIIFALIAYFLGHLLFMVSSWLDPIYEANRQRLVKLRNHKRVKENAILYDLATVIKKTYLDADQAQVINTFKWCTAVLNARFPDAILDVNRLVADSKFFRSILVLLPISIIIFFVFGAYPEVILAIILMGFSYCRYFERRLKSTTRAYQYIIMLEKFGKLKV